MPTPIELTLSSLLPTISLLPPELIALATSLLAQSRNKASTLKPEEEIGRTYACCHIACDRLKNKLPLEIAKPTPPVKPRVYNKLYAYLDSVLKTTPAPRTPTTKRSEDRLGSEARTGSHGSQRHKEPSASRSKDALTPSSARKRMEREVVEDGMEPPRFVMPIIKHLCDHFQTPEAAYHVYTGVCYALKGESNADSTEQPPSKRRKSAAGAHQSAQQLSEESLPTVITLLYVATVAKMYGLDDIRAERLAVAVELVEAYCEEELPALDINLQQDLKALRPVAEKWVEMEWYRNVPTFGFAAANEADDDVEIEGNALRHVKRPWKTPLRRKEKRGAIVEDDCGAAGLLPGLGTMFQPAIDWLSDERRAEYASWKEGILHEIALIEQNA